MSTPIMQLANAQLQDARTVILKPYDKSLVKEMSGSLQNANLGCNIQSEDVLIKLVFPMQTEENRKNNVKKVKEFLETAKLRIRQERQKVQTKIKANEVLTQDQKRNFETELDKTIKNANLKLENMFKTKEQELMKI
jgi:ribosome recycling factor